MAAVLLAACNFHVSGLGSPPGEAVDLGAAAIDLAAVATTADLATTVMSGGDLATGAAADLATLPMSCTPGARLCADATHSAVCGAAPPMAIVDRACPPSSSCSNGYCAPPPGAASCTRSADCSGGQVCDLFVVGGVLAGSCAPPLAGGHDLYSACGPPYGVDGTCKTGACALDANDPSLHQCLFPCGAAKDCPGGNNCDPVAGSVTIEGVSAGALRFCAN